MNILMMNIFWLIRNLTVHILMIELELLSTSSSRNTHVTDNTFHYV